MRTSRRSMVVPLASVVVAASLLLAACGGDTGGSASGAGPEVTRKPEAGGQINVALAGEADGYNSTVNRWTSSTLFQARALFDPLSAFDEKGEAQPYLAESFTPNASFTEWTVKARPGVKFHNGEAFDGAALKLHLDKVRSSAVTGGTLRSVTSIEQADPMSVKVTLAAPWSHFPVVFASQVGFVAAPAQLNATA
jgi:peptide/nickel transport system substrate-binding protein